MQSTSSKREPSLFFVINGGSGRQNAVAARQAIDAAMAAAGRKHRIFVIENA
ncbi:MAG TPA: diacylglycerol kinase, partial [Pusillimonas sp.]|nr:diacylglycerol kinase [Pusillimonas sp.]